MPRTSPLSLSSVLLSMALMVVTPATFARQGQPPYSLAHPAKSGIAMALHEVGTIDAAQRAAETDATTRVGMHAKRLAVAEGIATSLIPQCDGTSQTLDDGSWLWRMQVRATGATDLQLDFSRYVLPTGATL